LPSRRSVHRIEGFVLAGGQSSRFGSDKALALLHTRTLLSHALAALRGLDLDPWIVTPQAAAYARYRARFVSNERPGRGPVEGVRVALHACPASWALILSVDMPGVTAAGLRPLLEFASREPPSRAFCYRDRSDRRHPFPGLYHRRLLEWLDRAHPAGSMQELLDRAEVVTLGPEDIPQHIDMQRVLRNVNRPADL
jgi:molybdopterin-guanine dinucleotide biosynthesis protein A